jgi:pantoate--beta-alanine ligase
VILIKNSQTLNALIKEKKAQNLKIGFVPTMGALHAGHLSLIKFARQKCDVVVCSIFVNPTQFNVASDLTNYPRPIEKDIQLLVQESCDVLFHPEVNEIYGNGLVKDSSSDYGSFIHLLEGASRPGHFDGVITIVKKLFQLSEPNEVFFGQKDYQQCLVVETLIQRNFPNIVFNLCPILREEDGLAMSSRNIRLSPEERKISNIIYKVLKDLKIHWKTQQWENALTNAKNILSEAPFKLEYLSVCNAKTLDSIDNFEDNAIALVAVQLGNTRLIDNILL